MNPDSAVELRFIFIELIRRTDAPLWSRLVAMGAICDALDQIKDDSARDIFVSQLSNSEGLRPFLELAREVKRNLAGQAGVFGRFFNARPFNQSKLSAFQRDALSDVLEFQQSLVGTEAICDTLREIKYADGLRQLNTFLSDKEFMSENYLINLMLMTAFPFEAEGSGFSAAFFRLLARYGVLRYVLAITAAAKRERFASGDFVGCVVVCTRFYEHNVPFRGFVDSVLETPNKLSLSALGGLVRDDS
jgi:hypothetical protein